MPLVHHFPPVTALALRSMAVAPFVPRDVRLGVPAEGTVACGAECEELPVGGTRE